jgi:hypothetical protein
MSRRVDAIVAGSWRAVTPAPGAGWSRGRGVTTDRPHEPRAWLMVTAAARPMLRWPARTLWPRDGAITRLPPLSCELRGR